MPYGDGTGPQGQGPGTGWGRGPCGMGMRRGLGRGMGYGRGFARGFGGTGFGFRQYQEPVELSKEEQKKILEAEKAEVEAELNAIQKRIEELK